MKLAEQLSMWEVYFNHLFIHPLLIGILVFSFIASISFFILFIKTDKIKTKTNYLYAIFFFLFSPFILSVFKKKKKKKIEAIKEKTRIPITDPPLKPYII